MVSDVPGSAGRRLPSRVFAKDQGADEATHWTRVEGAAVSDMQAVPREPCRTPSGREASHTHQARLRPGRRELVTGQSVWHELKARGTMIATVPFTGRAGRGGRIDRFVLSRLDGDELVDAERWTSRDELRHALEAPVWDRFGSFAGQPQIAGTVTWTTADRRVVLEGRRGDEGFKGVVSPAGSPCPITARPVTAPARRLGDR